MVTDETPASPPKMRTHDVSVFYGDKKAVDSVTIDIPREFVTAFIGPSGCGKSTFLRALNRMNDTIEGARVEGKITLDHRDVYDPGLDVVELRARVGMVFQKPNPFPKSIFENVSYGPRIHGLANNKADLARIEELIDELRGRYAIVIVTHSMQQAARVSQRTAFFHLGKMVEYGDTSEIFTNPREIRTKDYITGRYG